MASYRSVRFHIAEAQKLADLTGVETDLLSVERFCERFLAEKEQERPDWELLEIICSAALVKYGRAFSSGVRASVPNEVVAALDVEYKARHQYFKDARDKWIAHSVNTFEENEVSAWLMPPERGPLGVTGISVRQHRVTSLSESAMTALSELASEVRRHLAGHVAEEKTKVLAIARAQPAEPFYSQLDVARLPGMEPPRKGASQK